MKNHYLFLFIFILVISKTLSYAQPTISSFAPSSGPVGTAVTITGTNFNAITANNIVFFGATQAIVNTATTTSLNVTVPIGASFQPISVLDITTGLTDNSAQPFNVTFACGGGISSNSFAAPIDSVTGVSPRTVCAADLDGDGKVDLVVGNQGSGAISVFRNTSVSGTISFDHREDFNPTGADLFNIEIADLDGDGKPDIVAANYYNSNAISVLRNTSIGGTISFATKIDFTTGWNPRSISMNDFNGDGKIDIAVVNANENTTSVLRNISVSGTISFASKVDFAIGQLPYDIVSGDLDGDMKPDIAAANRNNSNISILRNTSTNGTISFAPRINFTMQGPTSVSIGDLDGDGKLDLAITNVGNFISVLRNTSTIGAISFDPNINYGTGINPYDVSLGDLDGNGQPDFVIGNSDDNTISVLENVSTIGTISFAAKTDFVTGIQPYDVSICDIDGDGKPDLAIANSIDNTLSVFKNQIFVGPTMTSEGMSTICNGEILGLQLTSDIPSSYVWLAIDSINTTGESLTQQFTDSINDTINNITAFVQTVSYSIIPTSSTGCGIGIPQVLTVTVNPTPTMNSLFAAEICSGSLDSLNILLTSDLPASYTWIAADNPNTTGERLTLQTTNTVSDLLVNNTTLPETVSYTVIPTSSIGNCTGTVQTVYVVVNALPIVSFSGLDSINCYTTLTQNLIGSPVDGTFSGNGISGSFFSPSVAGSGLQTVTYTYTDNNNCSNTSIQNTEVLPLPVAPSICMVTADSTSTNNIIYWDKTSYSNVDSFIVYRETVSNMYQKIGAVSMDSMSMFTDTVRQLYFPFTGDPNAGTYRYKLQIRDTCGNYGPLSLYHNTLYVTQTGGAFNWNDYQIEGAAIPIPELTAYYLYRDNNSTGNWALVNGVSGSQLTINDANYSTYPNARWRIETAWSISCEPTRATVSTARSNIKGQIVNGISAVTESAAAVSIYPNPFLVQTTIVYMLDKKSDVNIEVYNALGQKMETLINANQIAGEYQYIFNAKEKSYYAGVYVVKVIVNGNSTIRRIVVME